jgi:hypothetical protein
MSSVIYAVWYEVDSSVIDTWNKWMESEHIPRVVSAGGFKGAKRYKIVDDKLNKYVTFYEANDMESLKRYLDGPAAQMRDEYSSMFGSNTKISRTILVEI